MKIESGMLVSVSGRGDLGMVHETAHLINKTVRVVKTCKSGLIQVEYEGKLYALPQRNLDPVEANSDNAGPD